MGIQKRVLISGRERSSSFLCDFAKFQFQHPRFWLKLHNNLYAQLLLHACIDWLNHQQYFVVFWLYVVSVKYESGTNRTVLVSLCSSRISRTILQVMCSWDPSTIYNLAKFWDQMSKSPMFLRENWLLHGIDV